jgi:hypothetical protein
VDKRNDGDDLRKIVEASVAVRADCALPVPVDLRCECLGTDPSGERESPA